MHKRILGIPVTTNARLSQSLIKEIVGGILEDWAWEGKQLGKVELISHGDTIRVCSYEKPIVKVVLVSD